MEENQVLNEGVEVVVAVPETEIVQPEVVTETVAKVETTETPTEEVAPEPIESRVDKAFSKRLAKEQEKIRKNVETELQTKYEKFQRVVEMGAKENGGMSVDDYINELLGNEPLPENVPTPEEVAQKSEAEIKAEKTAYWKGQAKRLSELGVSKLEDVPDEVMEKALENDTDVAWEYAKWERQNAIKNAEKETIRKIAEQETPGSLSGSLGVDTPSINDIPYNSPEFEKILQKVLRG